MKFTGIAAVIDIIINPVIIVGFVAVLIFLLYISKIARGVLASIDDRIYGTKGRGPVINRRTLAMKQREAAPEKREDVDEIRDAFNVACSKYAVLGQLIPIFPLLGILGTVAGLILQVGAMDVETLTSALDTAMSSTLWGLIAAVILKLLDAFLVVPVMSKIEGELNEQERKFSDAIALRRFDEEE